MQRLALLLLALSTGAAAHDPLLPCKPGERECAFKAIKASPPKRSAFWKDALSKPVEQRIGAAPPELVRILRLDNIANDIPNQPRPAKLTPAFLADVRSAWTGIPEAVKRLAASKLAGIYFVDDIGGTGFTDAALDANGKPAAGFIILDPSVLEPLTANSWATWKESSPFKASPLYKLEARIADKAGDNRVNAIQYILLHEIAHVVSLGTDIHPYWGEPPSGVKNVADYPFFSLSWTVKEGKYATVFDEAFPERRNVAFYFGAKLAGEEMIRTYDNLERTNFATLYGATHPGDDFAEAFVSYVHVVMMGRPFEIRMIKDGALAKTYRPCWEEPRCAPKKALLERLLGRASAK